MRTERSNLRDEAKRAEIEKELTGLLHELSRPEPGSERIRQKILDRVRDELMRRDRRILRLEKSLRRAHERA